MLIEYLAWLEETPFSTWMRESAPAFFLSLVFHSVAMGFVVGPVRAAAADAVPASARTAAVSLTCWIGVIVCGRLITYYRPPYHWCFWC